MAEELDVLREGKLIHVEKIISSRSLGEAEVRAVLLNLITHVSRAEALAERVERLARDAAGQAKRGKQQAEAAAGLAAAAKYFRR